MRRARVRMTDDDSQPDDIGKHGEPPTDHRDFDSPNDEDQENSLELVVSGQDFPHAGPRVGPGRRSRYSMNYQSYEATRIQPAEQTRRMLDYMFPGYQKRDPRNWYEKATQTNLNRDEVTGLIGIELMETEPLQSEEDQKSTVDQISHIPVDDDEEGSPVKQQRFQKPARSSVIAKGWDGPPIKVTGKTSEEGFHIEIHDMQHEPQAIMVPKNIFDQNTLRLDVVPDNRGIPKIVVYVGDKDRTSSDTTIGSNRPESTVVVFDNKDGFESRSISTISEIEEEKDHSPSPEPSSVVLESTLRVRDSVGVVDDEATRVRIEYDLDDQPDEHEDEPEESEPRFNNKLGITNSRLLEPVYSEGDKDDVDVDVVSTSSLTEPASNSDRNLSKEVSGWLAIEIFPKAMTPRKSPREKSESPEPIIQEPPPKEPTPKPSPVSPPEPEMNLSKEVSDWLKDNIFDDARNAADDRKMSKEVSDWLQKNILANAKQAADLPKKPKPEPPEPVKVPEPEPAREPSFTKVGSHASDPGDRLFDALENYPNNMDDDDLKSKNIPTVPPITPSQVSTEDEPLRALEDYPPQYSSSHDSPSTSRKASDSKSPSPIAVGVSSKQPEPALKAGSHSSSPGDRLFSPLEDHPSNVSDEDESPRTTQSKTPSPKPMFKLEAVSIEDKKHEPSPTSSLKSETPFPKPIFKLEAVSFEDKKHEPSPTNSSPPNRDSPPHIELALPSPEGDSEAAFYSTPAKKDDRTGPNESDVNKWLDDEILTPASVDSWVDNNILKKAQSLANDDKEDLGVPTNVSMDIEPKPETYKRRSSADPKLENQVEEWMENEVLVPAQVDNWVDKKILKPAEKQMSPDSGRSASPVSGGSSLEVPIQQPRTSHTSGEVESWVSQEGIEPAAASSWVESEFLHPAEVSVDVEDQVLEPASSRALEPSPPASVKSPIQKSDKSLKFDVPMTLGKEDEAALVVKGPPVLLKHEDKVEKPLEKKPVEDDSLSWVDSSHNLSPFQPHPDHPGDGPILHKEGDVQSRFPQFPDEKPPTPSLMQGQPPQSARSDYPNTSFPPTTYGQPQQGQPAAVYQPQQGQPAAVYGQPQQGQTAAVYGQPQQGQPAAVYGQPQQGQPAAAYGQPTAPLPGPSTQSGPPSPTYGKQPDAAEDQPVHFAPSKTPSGSEQPTSFDETSTPHGTPLGRTLGEPSTPFIGQPSHPEPPPKPKETSSIPSSLSHIPVSKVESEPSWGTQDTRPDKQNMDGSRGRSAELDKEKKRESILKNAGEHLEEMSGPQRKSSKPKTETRTSLIEKTRIQQDNYLTRDDDNDYKQQASPSVAKRKISTSNSSVQQRRSDSFLSDRHRKSSSDRSHSFFGRLCSPLSKIVNKHKSPPKGSRGSSYGSSDEDVPPIPTKEKSKAPKRASMSELEDSKYTPESSHESEVGDEKLPHPKPDLTEPIKEESVEGECVPQQPNIMAEQPSPIALLPNIMAEQPSPIALLPMYEQSGQSAPSPMHEPGQGAESPMYGQPMQYMDQPPIYGQPPQGLPSNFYGDPSQIGQPSPLPYQSRSVGAPTPIETKYPEDIQTSTLPKFSDYEEAAKRRVKPEVSAESPRIPHPPKKGIPTFPDYEDLTTPKDKVAAKDHSWYDAEGQPATSPFASKESFPEGSLAKKISAETVPPEVPQHIDTSTSPYHSITSDIRKEEGNEKKSSIAKYPRPMPPGNGIPMFSDYHDLPAGQFPVFRDSPKMSSSQFRPKNNMPPGTSMPTDASGSNYAELPPSGLPYPAQPLQGPTVPMHGTFQPQGAKSFTGPQSVSQQKIPNVQTSGLLPSGQKPMTTPTTVSPSQAEKPWTQPGQPIGSSSPAPRSQRPWEIPTSRPQGPHTYPKASQPRPGEMPSSSPQDILGQQPPHAPKITRYSYSHPDRPLSELTQPNLPVSQQGSNIYPEKQRTQDVTAHSQDAMHIPESSSFDLAQQRLPTFQKAEPYVSTPQQAGSEQTYDPNKYQPEGYSSPQMPSMQKPGFNAQNQPSMMSTYKTPHSLRPWEIPSSRPYSPADHQMPSMNRPGDYDQRQMFNPQGPSKQGPGSWPSTPTLEPKSASTGQTPMDIRGYGYQQQAFDPQGLPKQAPGAHGPILHTPMAHGPYSGSLGTSAPGQNPYSGSSGAYSPGQNPYYGPRGAFNPDQTPYSGSPGASTPGQNPYSGSSGASTPGQNPYSGSSGAYSPRQYPNNGSLGAYAAGQNPYSGSPGASTPGQNPYSGSPGAYSPGQNPHSGPPGASTPGQNLYSGSPGAYSPGQNPYSSSPGASTPGQNLYSGSPRAYSPGQNPNTGSSGKTPQTPTLTKQYYLQPDRPLSELLHPRSQNQQQGSPLPNFQKQNSPLAPGSGIPKFGDYDEIVQSSQPQISGDHHPSEGKRKIVTAAEKKAQIEKEMLPITEQMKNLKKQMYLLTSQKGPPIRTGPHSAHSRLPTSLELYQELERRTLDATKKEREEFRAEQRKKVYEESARRKIRRAIERSKTTK